MICNCEDWRGNIDKLNAPTIFLQVTRSHMKPEPVKLFAHCPWCGKQLIPETTCDCEDWKDLTGGWCPIHRAKNIYNTYYRPNSPTSSNVDGD